MDAGGWGTAVNLAEQHKGTQMPANPSHVLGTHCRRVMGTQMQDEEAHPPLQLSAWQGTVASSRLPALLIQPAQACCSAL